MARRTDTTTDRTVRGLQKALRRLDQLPVLDDRHPDDILEYDENGVPAQRGFQIRGPKIPSAVDDFLKHRHRDWER